MRGNELLEWLLERPAAERDRALEDYLGIAGPAPAEPPGTELIGYHASGVAAIVRALDEVPLMPSDVLIDLGAGLGKVVLLAHLLTGASAQGVELQPELAARAEVAIARLGLAHGARVTQGDARHADLERGTVFYLYAPFTGSALGAVLERIERIAAGHAIVVCALGVDLHRAAPWLVPRVGDSFWLTVYDSVVGGASPREAGLSVLCPRLTDIVTRER